MIKKQTIIICAFILSVSLLEAQTGNKPVTVRIKKVENINGVEKVTDTTFTTTDPSVINAYGSNVKIIESEGGKGKKVVIVESNSDNNGAESNVRVMRKGENSDEEIEKILKEAGVDPNMKGEKRVVIINEDGKEHNKGEKKITKIVIVKMDLSDASEGECKKAGISQSKNKLVIEDMNCTPNPSTGKFNLKFSSPDKSDADITIKDISGKLVYTENVKQFSGNYNKEINIDNNAKGIYFVTITQGIKATTKKLVVE